MFIPRRGYRFKKTGKRNEIFLATKFGFESDVPDKVVNGDPEYVRKAIQKSLDRLGVNFVDLYYLHRYVQPSPPLPACGTLYSTL